MGAVGGEGGEGACEGGKTGVEREFLVVPRSRGCVAGGGWTGGLVKGSGETGRRLVMGGRERESDLVRSRHHAAGEQ